MSSNQVNLAPRFDPGQFFATYSGATAAGGLAVSTPVDFTIPVQASFNFIWSSMAADFDQSDWSIQIFLTGLGRNLFDRPIRGSTLFGDANTAAIASVYHHGFKLPRPQPIPANSIITVTITNGPTGVLNLQLSLFGTSVQ